jgi:hypothetical protein
MLKWLYTNVASLCSKCFICFSVFCSKCFMLQVFSLAGEGSERRWSAVPTCADGPHVHALQQVRACSSMRAAGIGAQQLVSSSMQAACEAATGGHA